MRRVGRRGLILGAGAGLLAGAAEYLSFTGAFDHRRSIPASAAQRFLASLEVLTAETVGVVHIAHSTHLLTLGGKRLLTDPWFYDPAFGALAHAVGPAVGPAALGRLDAILVTHDHADHADLRAMDEMDKRARVIVATNDLAARVRARGFGEVVVLAPWESDRLGDVTVTAVPGLHDVYEIGFVVAVQKREGEARESGGPNGAAIYFAGDSRLHPDLPAIAERFAPAMAILPVDGTRLTGGALHVMTPEDAVTAARTLGVKKVMPSHAEAYFTDPIAEHVLASTVSGARSKFAALMQSSLPAVKCAVPEPGEIVFL